MGIVDRFHELVMLDLTGSINQGEKLELDAYLRHSQAARETYARMKLRHDAVSSDQDTSGAQEAWQRVDAIITPAPKFQRVGRGWRVACAAAAALLLIGAAYYSLRTGSVTFDPSIASITLSDGKVISIPADHDTIALEGDLALVNRNRTISFKGETQGSEGDLNTLYVPPGQNYQIELADGTTVLLNSMTRVRFPFTFGRTIREISIEGEAFVKVAKDAKRPFLVRLPTGTVQVLGTSFNVNTYQSERPVVSLLEGKVRLTAGAESRELTPGLEASLNNGQIDVQPFDRSVSLSWVDGLHIFQNATLTDIITVLPRWYGVKVQLDDSRLGERRFSGVIDRDRPVYEFLETLKATKEIDYAIKDQVIHIK